jgi:hypothetical protein
MAKVFYTDHDIEDLAKQGVTSIELNDDVVLTDLAIDKARRVGINLITTQEAKSSSKQATKNISASTPQAPQGDMETRVFAAVKKRLGDQVDDTLLRTIVKRVIDSLGSK